MEILLKGKAFLFIYFTIHCRIVADKFKFKHSQLSTNTKDGDSISINKILHYHQIIWLILLSRFDPIEHVNRIIAFDTNETKWVIPI